MLVLPDVLRAVLGRVLVWTARLFKVADIPSSDALFADNTAEIAARIQSYMDAVDGAGKRVGWRAGKAILDAARKPGEILFQLPEWLLLTLFMGLPGTKTPQTVSAAKAALDGLKQKYLETGRPDYLFAQAVASAVAQLQAADEAGNWLTAGVLKKLFETRRDPTPPLGWRSREAVVLLVFKNNPAYAKFLTVENDGSLSLPRGTSYEEFAASMLTNAYGVYPF